MKTSTSHQMFSVCHLSSFTKTKSKRNIGSNLTFLFFPRITYILLIFHYFDHAYQREFIFYHFSDSIYISCFMTETSFLLTAQNIIFARSVSAPLLLVAFFFHFGPNFNSFFFAAQNVPFRPNSVSFYVIRLIFDLFLSLSFIPKTLFFVRRVFNAFLLFRFASKPFFFIRFISNSALFPRIVMKSFFFARSISNSILRLRTIMKPLFSARSIFNPLLFLRFAPKPFFSIQSFFNLFLSFRFIPQPFHRVRLIPDSVLFRQFISNPFFSSRNDFRVGDSNFHTSQRNLSANCAVLLFVRYFLLSNHSEKLCLTYLNHLLHDLDIDAASRFIQILYQIFDVFSCLWFSPVTNHLMAQLFFRYTIAVFVKSNWPWNPRAAAFVYQLIIFTCGPPFYERSDSNSAAMRCRKIFRQCVQKMDMDFGIYCFWLFTHTDFAVTMTCLFFKNLASLHWNKHWMIFRFRWLIYAGGFPFNC